MCLTVLFTGLLKALMWKLSTFCGAISLQRLFLPHDLISVLLSTPLESRGMLSDFLCVLYILFISSSLENTEGTRWFQLQSAVCGEHGLRLYSPLFCSETSTSPHLYGCREFSCDGDKETVAGQPRSSSCHHMQGCVVTWWALTTLH